jgi:hypothetical protein
MRELVLTNHTPLPAWNYTLSRNDVKLFLRNPLVSGLDLLETDNNHLRITFKTGFPYSTPKTGRR